MLLVWLSRPGTEIPSTTGLDMLLTGERPEAAPTRLGQLLVSPFGLLTEAQLEQALAAQRGTPKRLGQVLVELGFIGEDDLRAVLDYQLHEHDGWLGLSRGALEGPAAARPRTPPQ
jgi:hypothetical protein